MKFPNTHMLVVLFVLLWQFPLAANAFQQPGKPQEPNTVEIGTGKRRTGPGPAVLVTVDKSRVRVGQIVTFSLTPESVVTGGRYRVTIDYGDGNTAVVTEPQVSHRYYKLGHYDVFASATQLKPDVVDTQDDPKPRIPRVSLIVKPNPAAAGATVAFTASLSNSYPNIKYRFAFGDKSETDWQDSSDTTHVYPGPGNYRAYVDIGIGAGGLVKQVAGSDRHAIEITSSPLGTVDLIANPSPVSMGQPVTFIARVNSSDSNIRYRFTFGDGSSPTGWQDSSQATHSYSAAGNYPAYVDVGLATNKGIRQVGSAREPVQVTSAPPVTVDLTATPTSIEAGQSVTFDARVDAGARNIKYRFVFGDNSAPGAWQDSARATHTYSDAGNYPAYVEIAQLTGGRLRAIARSEARQISVTPEGTTAASPTPTPTPTSGLSPTPENPTDDGKTSTGTNTNSSGGGSSFWNSIRDTLSDPARNWWKYLLLLLLIIAGYWTWKYFFTATPTFSAHPDVGPDMTAGSPDLTVDFQVILNPNVADGQYLVFTDEANVVRSVRRENG